MWHGTACQKKNASQFTTVSPAAQDNKSIYICDHISLIWLLFVHKLVALYTMTCYIGHRYIGSLLGLTVQPVDFCRWHHTSRHNLPLAIRPSARRWCASTVRKASKISKFLALYLIFQLLYTIVLTCLESITVVHSPENIFGTVSHDRKWSQSFESESRYSTRGPNVYIASGENTKSTIWPVDVMPSYSYFTDNINDRGNAMSFLWRRWFCIYNGFIISQKRSHLAVARFRRGAHLETYRIWNIYTIKIWNIYYRYNRSPKKFWRGCAAPVFDRIPLAKESLVEIMNTLWISWSWAHSYVILRNFSRNIPMSREIFRKQTII